MSYSNSKVLVFIGSFLCLLLLMPITPALADYPLYLTFRDGLGDPIVTTLDVRVSLWDAYDVRSGDIDGSGNINTSATHYGGYQTTKTITPNSNGNYKIPSSTLTSFPSAIEVSKAFLQLEYKAQGAPNTDYQVYDFVDDPPWQNISRYLLIDEASYYTSDAGPRTNYNTFTLDANNNASSAIKLEFGETLANSLSYNIASDWFELNDGLKITGDAGQQKLAVVANASDPADQAQFEVRTSGNVLMFSVDQDGEVDVDRGGTLRNLMAGTGSATDDYQPLMDAGSDSDGTVAFNATFASIPNIQLTIHDSTTANIIVSAWVTTKSTTGFTYKVTMYNGSTITDQTSAATVHWVAIGQE